MNRRTFLRASALGTLGVLAGCAGTGNDGPPPRKSEVIERVKVKDSKLVAQMESSAMVMSRADVGAENTSDDQNQTATNTTAANSVGGATDAVGDVAAMLNPVGVAAAKGRGGGRGGRGAAAGGATGTNGRAKLWGGAYVATWYDDHDDEVEEYSAVVVGAGIAYLAPLSAGEGELPGPGPVPWDQTWEADEGETLEGETLEYDFKRTGWYRFGTNLNAEDADHDFGWEAVDFKVEQADDGSYEVANQWKVSPTI